MSKISDFTSNSIMGVVRKIVNHIVDNVDPQISDATDHLPARFSGTFNDKTRNLTMTIESQGASAENLVATVNIPSGGGSGGSVGPTYSAGNGISITPENAIEIDTNVTATVSDVNAKVGKNQGTANAGKVLGIDNDGMVAPIDVAGSDQWILLNRLSDITASKVKIGSELIIRCNISSSDTTASDYFIEGKLTCTFTISNNPVFTGSIIATKDKSSLILSEIRSLYPNYLGTFVNNIGNSSSTTQFTFNNTVITNLPLFYLYIKY